MINLERCTHAYYDPANGRIQTLATVDGIGVFSGDKYLAPAFEFMTFEEADTLAVAAAEAKYCKPWRQITKEEWWEMLEVLPPENYQFIGAATCFRMCEYDRMNLTGHYVKIADECGDEYWYATRPAVREWSGYLDEIKKAAEGAAG
jgi:hypothetical protein